MKIDIEMSIFLTRLNVDVYESHIFPSTNYFDCPFDPG